MIRLIQDLDVLLRPIRFDIPDFAGQIVWVRLCIHPGDRVLHHPSACSDVLPTRLGRLVL